MTKQPLLSSKDAATLAGLSLSTFYSLCKRKLGPRIAHRNGMRRFYTRYEIEQWTFQRKHPDRSNKGAPRKHLCRVNIKISMDEPMRVVLNKIAARQATSISQIIREALTPLIASHL